MRNKITITIILIITLLIILLYLVNKYVSPILNTFASSETVNISTIIINESVREVSKNINEDIIKVVTNDEGVITSVDFDIPTINDTLYDVTKSIIKNFRNIETKNVSASVELLKKYDKIIYKVPVGVIFGNSILSNFGPNIEAGASLIGDVTSDVKTVITPYGINNSLIKIYVRVNVSSMIILPFKSNKISNSSEVLIGMKIVQGIVPEYYGEGLSNVTPLVRNDVNVLE